MTSIIGLGLRCKHTSSKNKTSNGQSLIKVSYTHLAALMGKHVGVEIMGSSLVLDVWTGSGHWARYVVKS